MKTVFNTNAETIHVWAQRNQPYGRSKGGNVFFENGRLYSYGYHFPIGHFIESEDGFVGAVIYRGFYSSSTSKHQAIAWDAVSHYDGRFDRKHTTENSVVDILDSLGEKLLKARKPMLYIREAEHTLAQHRAYLKFIDGRAELSDYVLSAYAPFQLSSEELAEAQKNDREERRKQKEKLIRLQEAKIQAFMDYKVHYFGGVDEDYIRISKDGDYVETSKGVKVPVREAKILYNKIVRGEDIKGFKIDYYTVISINGCLKIGCHDINLKNMHEVGKQLL